VGHPTTMSTMTIALAASSYGTQLGHMRSHVLKLQAGGWSSAGCTCDSCCCGAGPAALPAAAAAALQGARQGRLHPQLLPAAARLAGTAACGVLLLGKEVFLVQQGGQVAEEGTWPACDCFVLADVTFILVSAMRKPGGRKVFVQSACCTCTANSTKCRTHNWLSCSSVKDTAMGCTSRSKLSYTSRSGVGTPKTAVARTCRRQLGLSHSCTPVKMAVEH
jgi:hypothetical protein